MSSVAAQSACAGGVVEPRAADRGGGQVQRGGDRRGQLQRHHQPRGAQRRRRVEGQRREPVRQRLQRMHAHAPSSEKL